MYALDIHYYKWFYGSAMHTRTLTPNDGTEKKYRDTILRSLKGLSSKANVGQK